MKETKIALGTWAWGAGMFGGDTVFGSNTDETNLKPVFDAAMKEIGSKYGLSCSQVGIAWALSKGTMPIIGATKERHVLEAAQVQDTILSSEEISRLETLADAAGIDTRGDWEHTME